MEVANTLAYYNTATITAVKIFIVQAPGHCTNWLMKMTLGACTIKTFYYRKMRIFVKS